MKCDNCAYLRWLFSISGAFFLLWWDGARYSFCAVAAVALTGLLPGSGGSKSWPAGCISFFRLVGWSAVVLMLGLMDLFATAFISFTSKNWQAVKWNFGLDFQLDCLETFVKIFCFCVEAASSTVIVLKGRKVIYCTDFLEWKRILVLGTVISSLHHQKQCIYYSVCSVRLTQQDS